MFVCIFFLILTVHKWGFTNEHNFVFTRDNECTQFILNFKSTQLKYRLALLLWTIICFKHQEVRKRKLALADLGNTWLRDRTDTDLDTNYPSKDCFFRLNMRNNLLFNRLLKGGCTQFFILTEFGKAFVNERLRFVYIFIFVI